MYFVRLRKIAGLAAERGVREPLAIFLLAPAIFLCPQISAALEYSRPAIERGQLYRLLTAHLTHFTLQHIEWDLLAFTILALMVARQSLARFYATILSSALAISLALLILAPEVTTYRGLSGIDSALFITAAVLLLKQSFHDRRPTLTLLASLALAAFLAKTLFELVTGQVLFVQNLGPSVIPIPLAHIVGAACGLLTAIFPLAESFPQKSSPILLPTH